MKLRKTIKKIVALGTGLTMLSATILGASAATMDLANYPSPFITDGKFSAVLVVGDKAAAEDVIGVSRYCAVADMQSGSDFSVFQTLNDEAGNLLLTFA